MTPGDWTFLVAALVLMAVLLWMTPSCGDPECVRSHQRHSIAQRAAAIERRAKEAHDVWHQPPTVAGCPYCRRSDE